MTRIYLAAMRVTLAALMAAGCIVLAPAHAAFACFCDLAVTAQEYRDRADVVFLGTIEQVRPAVSLRTPRYTVTFAIQRLWKGQASSTIEVSSETSSSGCGVDFSLASTWLVYAYRGSDGLDTNMCSGNKAFASAQADLATLGEGYTPSTNNSTRSGGGVLGGRLGRAGIVVVVAGLAAGAGWLIARRVRPHRGDDGIGG